MSLGSPLCFLSWFNVIKAELRVEETPVSGVGKEAVSSKVACRMQSPRRTAGTASTQEVLTTWCLPCNSSLKSLRVGMACWNSHCLFQPLHTDHPGSPYNGPPISACSKRSIHAPMITHILSTQQASLEEPSERHLMCRAEWPLVAFLSNSVAGNHRNHTRTTGTTASENRGHPRAGDEEQGKGETKIANG